MSLDKTKRYLQAFRARLGQKGEVRILLSKDRSGEGRGGELEDGPSPPPPRQESMLEAPAQEFDYVFPRPKGDVRFFDLGRLANGDELEDFVSQPDFPYDGDGNVNPFPQAGASVFESFEAYLASLLVDGEDELDREDVFYEIKRDDGDFYRLNITGDGMDEILTTDSDLWTDNGAKLTPAQLGKDDFRISVDSGGRNWRFNLFYGFYLDGEFRSRVTSTLDPEADDITDFRLKAGDKVFLYPHIISYTGSAGWYSGGPRTYLHYDYRVGLREFYVGNHDPLIDPDYFYWSRDFSSTNPYYNESYAVMRYVIERPSARAWKIEYDFDNEVWDFGPVDPDTGFIPYPPFDPAGDTTATPMFFSSQMLRVNYPQLNGLAAVVKRGSSLYYIWGQEF